MENKVSIDGCNIDINNASGISIGNIYKNREMTDQTNKTADDNKKPSSTKKPVKGRQGPSKRTVAPVKNARGSNSGQRRILILAANPSGTDLLHLGQEVRDIEEALRRAVHWQQFEVYQRWAVRLKDIKRAMLDTNPHIVHFSGHGTNTQGSNSQRLMFENDIGRKAIANVSVLADLFELFSKDLECVILNACYSESQAQAISKYIPYVIGTKGSIPNKAAIAFANGFYDALAAGRSIEFAYDLGCREIPVQGKQDDSLAYILLKK